MIWPPGTARAFIQGEFYQQFFWKVIIVIGFIIIFLIVYTLVKQWKNTSVNVKRFMIPAALGVFFYCIGFPCCTAKECKEFFSSVIMCIFPNNYEVICSFIETNFLGLSGFFFCIQDG